MESKSAVNYFALVSFVLLLGISMSACKGRQEAIQVSSPDERLNLTFLLKDGDAAYKLYFNHRKLVKNSKLGFTFESLSPMSGDFELENSEIYSRDETWVQKWDQKKEIRNHFNGLRVTLIEKNSLNRKLILVFEVFNDGLGFRYELPEQENLGEFSILDELTEFNMKGNISAWSIGSGQDEHNEIQYIRNKLSEISDTVHTPFILESPKDVFVSINETKLTSYASMALYTTGRSRISCDLISGSGHTKVYGQTPFVSPWRIIQVAECPEDLLSSFLILNLNKKNTSGDAP